LIFLKKRIDPADPVKTRNPGLGPGRVLKLWVWLLFFYKNQTEPKMITPSLKWQRATTKVSWFLGFVGHVPLMMIIRPIYRGHVVKRYVFHSFETRPGPAGRPGAGTGSGWRKNKGRKNPAWPGWPGKTRLQTRWLLFFFLFFN
jgi:hypothetical protein